MCDLLAFEADRRAVNITINRQVLVSKGLLTRILTAAADSLHFEHMGYTMSVLAQNCFDVDSCVCSPVKVLTFCGLQYWDRAHP